MGYILNKSEGASERVHAEARSESFVLYTAFGVDRMELPWPFLADVIQSAQALTAYRKGPLVFEGEWLTEDQLKIWEEALPEAVAAGQLAPQELRLQQALLRMARAALQYQSRSNP